MTNCSIAPSSIAWDIIILGYNINAPIEMGFTPGIDFGAVFSAKYPNARQLNDFQAATNAVCLQRLMFGFGLSGYVVTPKGAETLIRSCFPLDSRPAFCRMFNYVIPSYTIDCILSTVYPSIDAYICLPPLVMCPNDRSMSNTIAR